MNKMARALWPHAKALKTERGALRRLQEVLPSDRSGIKACAIRVQEGWLAVAFLSDEATWQAGMLARLGVCVTNVKDEWDAMLSEVK